MNLSASQIKILHTIVFLFLMACLVYATYSALVNKITVWTWLAILLIFMEGLVLVYYRWKCPLTIWAENRGAENGAVADIFLPKVIADRLFPVYGLVYVATVALIVFRSLT